MKNKKVYGGLTSTPLGVQCRAIFCGTQKQCAEAIRCSLSFVRNYWSETGNALQLEIATRHPGVLFIEHPQYQGCYFPAETVDRLRSEGK